MATYSEAKPSVYDLMRQVIADKFAATLEASGVRVGLLMAHSTKPHRPALKIRGYPVAAKVKVVGLEDRVAGAPDARIVIDAGAWAGLGERRREALIAHELYHLKLDIKDGEIQTDDIGRPKLRNRPHDVEAGMFREVWEWYGEDACEAAQRDAVEGLFSQRTLPFGESEAGRGDPAWPSDAADDWRLAPVGELGLDERTVEALEEHDIATVGEVVALEIRDMEAWLPARACLDIDNGLDRFRGTLSDAQLADLDAAPGGAPAPEPKPGRRKKVGA